MEQVARTVAFAVRVSSPGTPRVQAHADDEISVRTKGHRKLDPALHYNTVDVIAAEKTRTAKSAVLATCYPLCIARS